MPDSDSSGPDLLGFVRAEIRHESGMLASRLGAFLTSQSFLVIAYASTMGAASGGRWRGPLTLAPPPALALLSLALTFHALPGIGAATAVIARWHARRDELIARDPGLRAYGLAASAAQLDRGRGSRRRAGGRGREPDRSEQGGGGRAGARRPILPSGLASPVAARARRPDRKPSTAFGHPQHGRPPHA